MALTLLAGYYFSPKGERHAQQTGRPESESVVVTEQPAAPPVKKVERTLEQRTGSHFIDLQNAAPHLGKVERLEIPDFPGAHAIWGGTGRDDRGHIWIGGWRMVTRFLQRTSSNTIRRPAS